eukprot:80263-Chlamydomonas_euryale.AAC.6
MHMYAGLPGACSVFLRPPARTPYRIRDKSVPKDWYKDVDLTILPPEPALAGTALDDLKKFFSSESLSSMFA